MIFLWWAWLSFSKMNAINKCIIIWMTLVRKDILLYTAQGMQILINYMFWRNDDTCNVADSNPAIACLCMLQAAVCQVLCE